MKYFMIILTVLAIAAGCSDEPPAGSPAAGPARKAEIEKWNIYVDLGNALETDLNPALQDYMRLFGYSPDYRPAERPEYVADLLTAMVANQELAQEIDRALARAGGADTDLDQATYEMSLTLKQLWASLVQARDFYAEGGPADEAAARKAHSDIFEAYMALEATRGRFWAVLSKEDAERRQRDIRDMDQRGLTLRPTMLRLLDRGQALQDYLSGQNVTSATLAALNVEAFQPLYDDFAKSNAEFDQLLDQTDDPGTESLKEDDLEKFSRLAWTALASAQQLIERRQNNIPVEGHPEEVPGTPEHFARKLGELVDLYNTMRP